MRAGALYLAAAKLEDWHERRDEAYKYRLLAGNIADEIDTLLAPVG